MSLFRESSPERSPQASSSGLLVDGSTQFLAITLPARDSAVYAVLLALVKDAGFQIEPLNRKWWLRDRHRVLEFLARHLPDLREKYRAKFTPGFEQRTTNLQFAKLTASATGTEGGFEISLELSAPDADEAALRAALARGQPYIETPRGLVLVNPDTMGRLAAAQQALGGPAAGSTPLARFRRTMSTAELPATESLLESLTVPFETSTTWKSRSESLRQLDRLASAPLPDDLAKRLRPYQRVGVAWLWHLWSNNLGGVLADEMGLGKTAQALAVLQCLYEAKSLSELTQAPSLVVAPAGLLGNWRREAAAWAPTLRAFTHHGAERLTTPEQVSAYHVVFTSYATLARDAELFAAVDWAVCIADEAQHAKNRRTNAARALRAVRAQSRFALTGTPLENSFDDLRSIFDFILPGYLAQSGGPRDASAVSRTAADTDLRRRAAPYVLRRTKALVAPELPPKIEQTVYCEFEPKQAALYAKVREKARAAFFQLAMGNASDGRLRFAAFEELLRLRQICAEPRLLEAEFAPEDSAKLRALQELLDEAVDGGHRALVFSQFTSVLDLIEPVLTAAGLPCLRLDGSTPPRDRLEICDRFNADAAFPVLLISLKAGGTGLNLTGADTVIHFDPWWNPAVEAQATDRAHRLGQKRTVTSYKLITAGTVEERILALQQSKVGLLADFFEESGAALEKISLADMQKLLED